MGAHEDQIRQVSKLASGIASLACALILAACGDGGGSDPTVASVRISPQDVELGALGDTRQLTATALDSAGKPVDGVTFTWVSSQAGRVSVDGTGLLTARANGAAAISARTANGTTTTITAHVRQLPVRVTIAPDNVELTALLAAEQLTATALDANDHPVAGIAFTWTSADTTRLTVDGSGVITAHANGSATISARTGNGASGEVIARVQQVAATIWVTPEEWPTSAAWLGARRQFQATVFDANGHVFVDAPVTWTAASPDLVSVDVTGLATARRASASTVARVIAQSGTAIDDVQVSPMFDPGQTRGYQYTAWLARTDATPAIIRDGRLTLPNLEGSSSVEFYGDVPFLDGYVPVWPHDTVEKFQYKGNRIALLTDMANGLGTLRIFDRAREMVILGLGNVSDFELTGGRIGVLFENGEFLIREGTLGGWHRLASSGATRIKVGEDYIGALFDDGTVRITDNIAGPLVPLDDGNLVDFALEGERIAILRADGLLRVKDGINSEFVDVAAGVVSFKLSNQRMGVILESGEFRVKDRLADPWVTLETTPLRQFELLGNRIATLSESGLFRARDGISGHWFVQTNSGAQAIQLQDDRVGYLDAAGRLRIKLGLASTDWRQTAPYGNAVTQFRLIVDNPSPPKRTTPASYAAGQQRCANRGPQSHVNDCYTEVEDRPIAPYYGLFCGALRPENIGEAMREHSIDSLDEMCAHHDPAEFWYPEWFHNTSDITGSCIVDYGIRRSRLTLDGAVIADGSSNESVWNSAWNSAGMPHLRDGLAAYKREVGDRCTDDDLQLFDFLTDAEHDL